MKKNLVNSIAVYNENEIDSVILTKKVNQFYIEMIEYNLSKFNYTAAEKIYIIDKIISELKSERKNKFIKNE